MAIPILTTKFFAPQLRPQRIARPRLLDQLDEGLQGKMTLVSAPAGFGKSTLVSNWVRQVNRPWSWLSLDEEDNDPVRFLRYFIAALQRIEKGVGTVVAAELQTARRPNLEQLVANLVNEISAMSAPFILVMDDYHFITNQIIHQLMAYLLDYIPPQMHLVLCSRTDPPWPIARLRATGLMNEVRSRELRFTADEMTLFFNDVLELALSPEDLAALDQRVEGWAAGLQMVGLSLQGHQRQGNAPAFIRTFTSSHRFILDFLVEEVLNQQPPGIRDFMLKTSILERLTAPLCQAVCYPESKSNTNPQEILTRLEKANLFLFPLDDSQRWYRYHHLFAELLRSQLEQTQPELVKMLHTRASQWYEEAGMVLQALHHALAVEDIDRVAHLVEGSAMRMTYRGERETLVRWLKSLPQAVILARPWLAVAQAWSLVYSGFYEDAMEAIQKLPALQNPSENDLHLQGHLQAIRCLHAGLALSDFTHAISHAQKALDYLPQDELQTRGLVCVVLALAQRMLWQYDAARESLANALAENRLGSHHFNEVDLLCQLARLETQEGKLAQAARTLEEAIELAAAYSEQEGRVYYVISYAHANLSWILLEWNRIEEAQHHAELAVEISQKWGGVDSLIGALQSLALVHIAKQEWQFAQQVLDQAKQATPPDMVFWQRMNTGVEIRLALRRKDYTRATRLAEAMAEGYTTRRIGQLDVLLAEILLGKQMAGEPQQLEYALFSLHQIAGFYEHSQERMNLVEVLLLKTITHHLMNQPALALENLAHAVTLSEPDGYLRVFLNIGEVLLPLLNQLAATHGHTPYLKTLLTAFEAAYPTSPEPAPVPSLLMDPLSSREMEVLQMLNTRLSVPEIADEMYVSTHTVRSHIKNIYSKLLVHKRYEAVDKAKKLGLIR